MTGSPASGKSTKKTDGLHGYQSRKLWKSAKCLEEAAKCAAKKPPFVIDNTDPTRESRKKFVDINVQYNLKGFVFHGKEKEGKQKEVGGLLFNGFCGPVNWFAASFCLQRTAPCGALGRINFVLASF